MLRRCEGGVRPKCLQWPLLGVKVIKCWFVEMSKYLSRILWSKSMLPTSPFPHRHQLSTAICCFFLFFDFFSTSILLYLFIFVRFWPFLWLVSSLGCYDHKWRCQAGISPLSFPALHQLHGHTNSPISRERLSMAESSGPYCVSASGPPHVSAQLTLGHCANNKRGEEMVSPPGR